MGHNQDENHVSKDILILSEILPGEVPWLLLFLELEA